VANLARATWSRSRIGFARNYLIPHGKARRATPANIAEFEAPRELEKAQAEVLAAAQEGAPNSTADAADHAEGRRRRQAVRFGDELRHRGSAGANGFEVPKAVIRMPEGPLKTVGDHDIKLACTPTWWRLSRCRCSASRKCGLVAQSKRVFARHKKGLAMQPFFFATLGSARARSAQPDAKLTL
jgi:large subunit ribosomal protein L9